MIFSQFFRVRRMRPRRRVRGSVSHFNAHRALARAHIQERLTYWSAVYGVTYGQVAIRNQSSRWGSCSKKGNLNFNYRIAFMPAHLLDYVIVHELCHLTEFNHSENFWNLVARAVPEYKKIRNELRTIDLRTLSYAQSTRYKRTTTPA
jgi:predicted metal-dependent hydrolase